MLKPRGKEASRKEQLRKEEEVVEVERRKRERMISHIINLLR